MTEQEHDQHDRETRETILQNIEKYGCHLALVEPDSYLPGFAYTIGFYGKYNHPEIICFGLHNDLMTALLNHARDLIKQGTTFQPGKPYEGFLKDYTVQFIEVEKEFYADYVGYAGWYYENSFDFPLLQLVWPDKQNLFPWEEDFNPDWKFRQPLLDRDTDFKFYEKRNLGVYTTKQAFEGEPILFVYHNADGDWQFHTSINPKMDDARLVCLEEIIKLDPTINEIYHLPYGWRAWRESINTDWEYEEDTEE